MPASPQIGGPADFGNPVTLYAGIRYGQPVELLVSSWSDGTWLALFIACLGKDIKFSEESL
jgi:hypothetical protein